MTTKMLAYVNTELSREEVIARVTDHRKANQLRAGIGWENGVGSAVGCTLHTYKHSLYPEKIGHPVELAYLEDAIFEGLHHVGEHSIGNAWPEDYLKAAAYGADLSMVWPRWALWMLDRLDAGCNDQVAAAINGVRNLYAEWVDTGMKPAKSRFDAAAAETAWAALAAAETAWAAAETAWAAAMAAAETAWAAAETAWAAAMAAAWAAAEGRKQFWLDARAELLRLMQSAPVEKVRDAKGGG